MSRNLKIAVFAVVAIAVAVLIGQTPDKGPYVELQETINKIQSDPMINEFGGVDGTTVLKEGDGILDVPPSMDGKYTALYGEWNGVRVPTPYKFNNLGLELNDGVIIVTNPRDNWSFFMMQNKDGNFSKRTRGMDVTVKLFLNRKDPYAHVFVDKGNDWEVVKIFLKRA